MFWDDDRLMAVPKAMPRVSGSIHTKLATKRVILPMTIPINNIELLGDTNQGESAPPVPANASANACPVFRIWVGSISAVWTLETQVKKD